MAFTLGESVLVLEKDLEKKSKMLEALKLKKPQFLMSYCVVTEGDGQLAVVPSWNLVQPSYPMATVIGIAGNRGDAMSLLTEIIAKRYGAVVVKDTP